MKSAFTLVELLVVMAIIAILAAILFPVLSNVKFQARKAASAANARQISLSLQLYEGDYDDMYPVLFSGPLANLQNWPDNHTPARTDSWAMITRPYYRSRGLMQDPEVNDVKKIFDADPVASNSAPNSYVRQNLWSFYGINHLYLTPMYCSDGTYTDCMVMPKSTSQVESPSSTIELTQTEDVRDSGPNPETSEGGGEMTSTAPGALGSLAPCDNVLVICTFKFVPISSTCMGGACGGLGPWSHVIYEQRFDRTSGCNVTMADGSAHHYSREILYGGTTHLMNESGEFVTEPAKYKWGPVRMVTATRGVLAD